MSTAQDLLGEAGTCKECRDLGGPCPRHREVVFGTLLELFRTDENRREGEGGEA